MKKHTNEPSIEVLPAGRSAAFDSLGIQPDDEDTQSEEERDDLMMQLCPPKAEEDQALLDILFPPVEPDDADMEDIISTDSENDEFPF